MSGIIEVWRKNRAAGLPVRYVVGNPPMLANSETPDSPVVKHIDYRETGSMAGKRLSAPVFCITFEESHVQRFIPEAEVVDVAYETKRADVITTPPLEE